MIAIATLLLNATMLHMMRRLRQIGLPFSVSVDVRVHGEAHADAQSTCTIHTRFILYVRFLHIIIFYASWLLAALVGTFFPPKTFLCSHSFWSERQDNTEKLLPCTN